MARRPVCAVLVVALLLAVSTATVVAGSSRTGKKSHEGNDCDFTKAETGDILVVRDPDAPGASVGSLVKKLYWNHSGMWDASKYTGKETDKCIWSALPKIGMCLQTPKDFHDCSECVLLKVEATSAQRLGAVEYCAKAFSDKKYKKWLLTAGRKNPDMVTCAKLVYDAYESQGVVLTTVTLVAPRDLLESELVSEKASVRQKK